MTDEKWARANKRCLACRYYPPGRSAGECQHPEPLWPPSRNFSGQATRWDYFCPKYEERQHETT